MELALNGLILLTRCQEELRSNWSVIFCHMRTRECSGGRITEQQGLRRKTTYSMPCGSKACPARRLVEVTWWPLGRDVAEEAQRMAAYARDGRLIEPVVWRRKGKRRLAWRRSNEGEGRDRYGSSECMDGSGWRATVLETASEIERGRRPSGFNCGWRNLSVGGTTSRAISRGEGRVPSTLADREPWSPWWAGEG